MSEIRLVAGLVCWQLGLMNILNRKQPFGRLKMPLLGCAVSFVVGCSVQPPHQLLTANHPETSEKPAKAPIVADPATQSPVPGAGSPKWELGIPNHSSVETWVQRFTQDKRESFQTQLGRARFYVVPAQEIFEQRGLPKDLTYVAMVESGFSPAARSHAKAVGMWQFIAGTGKRFGLEQNQWIDERRHPLKAARAAADYLSFLYDTFGSWDLALAAYNAGENKIQGALDRSGLKTFWELTEAGYLPEETCNYVPKVFAAVKIIRDPMHYGFHFDPQQYTPKHETVSVPGGVKLAWIEKRTGIPESTLRDHNPELIRPLIPPGFSDYELCVPIGTGESVLTALTERPVENEKSVRKTTDGSKKPDGSERARFASTKSVTVVAPKRENTQKSLTLDSTAKKPVRAAQKSCKSVRYPVRRGDTFQSIAERFRVSVEKLSSHNGLSRNQKLAPGTVLTICIRETELGNGEKRRRN